MPHPDLELVTAALDRDERALEALDAEIVLAAKAATKSTPDLANDVAQELRRELVTAKREDSKLPLYRATGSLRAWLRTMAVRVALKLTKKTAREEPAELYERVSDAQISPELALFKAQHRDRFAAIFSRALAQLEPRQRTMLKLKYLDQLTVKDIGRAYQLHHSNVVRTLQKTEAALLETVRREFARELQLSEERVDSAIDALVSGLHPSVWRDLD